MAGEQPTSGGGQGLNMNFKGDSKSEKSQPNSLTGNASVNGGTFTGPTINKGISGTQLAMIGGTVALVVLIVILWPRGRD